MEFIGPPWLLYFLGHVADNVNDKRFLGALPSIRPARPGRQTLGRHMHPFSRNKLCSCLAALGLLASLAATPAVAGRQMPDMRGWTRLKAVQWMNRAGLQFKRVRQVATSDPALDEKVINTIPRAGAMVEPGRWVSFSYYVLQRDVLLDGRVKTPSLIGLDRNEALLKVLAAGLKPLAVAGPRQGDGEEASAKELVFEQEPGPGRPVAAGSTVRFSYLPLPGSGRATPSRNGSQENCRWIRVRLKSPRCVEVCRLRPVCKPVTKCFKAPECEKKLVCKPKSSCPKRKVCKRRRVCDSLGNCRLARKCRLVANCGGRSRCSYRNVCMERTLCKKVKACTNFRTCRPLCRTSVKRRVCAP